jgi:gliding motility-associated-like protein
VSVFATHNRAGEIIYEHVSGYTYKVTIITITKASSQADRPWLKIYWGDEPSDVTESQLDSLPRSSEVLLVNDAKRNEYFGFHTYSGPGVYTLMMIDPNRNEGVVNITQSVNQVFSIQSQLLISPGVGHNNSVQLLNPPTQQACIFQPWIHNPSAFDPDGDSLSYHLVSCLGDGGESLNSGSIPAWVLPNEVTPQTSDIFTINVFTGDVNWITPLLAGQYNIAIKIVEWRGGIPIGFVMRDMQIDVITCSNLPPVMAAIPDQCVTAGGNVSFSVNASDPNTSDNLMIEAFGGPMTEVVHQASFNGVSWQFNWNPQCEEVRSAPYQMIFQVTDDGFVNLSDLETMNIAVVAPRVENPSASPFNNGILVDWDPHICQDAFSEYEASQVQYWIYKRNGSFGFEPDACELGVPSYTGYEFLAAIDGVGNHGYLDTEVNFGANYCYMIVTRWPDGALSYASEEICAQLEKRVPIITKASVVLTDFDNGADSIMWSPPIPEILNQYPGPFHYELLHGNAGAAITEVVFVGPESADLYALDTVFYHSGINTIGISHQYRIALYSDTVLVGTSSAAMTPWMWLTPLDNAMDINVVEDVPWDNVRYQYYRKAPSDLEFLLWKDTTAHHLVDVNLNNNQSYCYKVLTIGTYGTTGVTDPLYNWSQEACASPYDQSPPCPPVLVIEPDCLLPQVTLHWNRPACADDVTGYRLYYTPVFGGEMQLLAEFNGPEDTTFVWNEDLSSNSIAGCFGITALDSLNLWPDGEYHQNESMLSDTLCSDNCPVYSLPNVFTPNDDDANDTYISFPYRSIDHVEMKIFNRWGSLVFETTVPDILWDGTDKNSGELCGDGVYFYVIDVFEIRLQGVVRYSLNGTIQLVDGKLSTPKQ